MKKLLTASVALCFTVASATGAAAYNQQDLVDRYSTLSGALINLQASNQKMSLNDYLGNTKATVYSLPETPSLSRLSILDAPGASAVTGTRLQASSLSDLNAQLVDAGLGFSGSDYQDVTSLAEAVKGKSRSVDALVTGTGAAWAASLASLNTPELSTPSVDQAPELPEVPAGALSFGLLLNKGLTQMALDSPKLFSQVTSKGVGSDAANTAWNSAFSKAYGASQQDLASVVPDSCTGGLLSVAATGDPGAANDFEDCGQGCKAAGQYLNNQVRGMFSTNERENRFKAEEGLKLEGNMNEEDLAEVLPGALAADVLEPSNAEKYGENLDRLLINNKNTCKAASEGTQGALAYALPEVWGTLTLD